MVPEWCYSVWKPVLEMLQLERVCCGLLGSHLGAPVDEYLEDGPALVVHELPQALVVLQHKPQTKLFYQE